MVGLTATAGAAAAAEEVVLAAASGEAEVGGWYTFGPPESGDSSAGGAGPRLIIYCLTIELKPFELLPPLAAAEEEAAPKPAPELVLVGVVLPFPYSLGCPLLPPLPLPFPNTTKGLIAKGLVARR